MVVLCGGKGTRAYPHTAEIPKPLLEVCGRPILRHVMDIYAAHGCRRFRLAAGFRAEMIEDFAGSLPRGWEVQVVDSGESAGTADRILSCRESLTGTFFATYGDGVGDVDIPSLLAFHLGRGARATLTSVPLRSQYGTVDATADGRVERFREKPVLDGHWVSGGFFVFDRSVFDVWEGDDLERDVLPALSARGELYSYCHSGFWRSLDTYKDALELDALAGQPRLPWLPWPPPATSGP